MSYIHNGHKRMVYVVGIRITSKKMFVDAPYRAIGIIRHAQAPLIYNPKVFPLCWLKFGSNA
ncbi:MAG: hypothetical protein K0Q94_2091 [Paenibacillus sp.]|jgi:hypothetical protein|nr:hypothetical protein [Paenibacillus sp.]